MPVYDIRIKGLSAACLIFADGRRRITAQAKKALRGSRSRTAVLAVC
jgi:hypothetical protein